MLPTIAALRPHDGERSHPRTFGPVAARLHGGTLEVGEAGGVVIDAPTATVIDGARREPLEALYRVSGGPTTAPSGGGPATGSGAKLRIDVVEGAAHAPTTGFYLPALGVYLELERALARSVLVQLLVFQRPEPEHFELVFGNDAARVYRLAR